MKVPRRVDDRAKIDEGHQSDHERPDYERKGPHLPLFQEGGRSHFWDGISRLELAHVLVLRSRPALGVKAKRQLNLKDNADYLSRRAVGHPFGVAPGEPEHVDDDDHGYRQPEQQLGQSAARALAVDDFGHQPRGAYSDDGHPPRPG